MFTAAIIVALMLVTASSGAIFKPGDWYEGLEKPSWTPPDWAFPVVWMTLYIMIGTAGWISWQQSGLSTATLFWGAQLVFNAAWSWLFFGLRRMDWAFVDVSLLWLSVAAFIYFVWPISLAAALLFIPYLAWVTIAASLNKRVWDLNPHAAAARG